jgi:integrase
VVALVYRPAQVKQRTPHEVPLVGRAQEVVQELWAARRLGCRLLFHVDGKPLRELKSEWRRACEAADVVAGRKAGGVVLYNLRHSCLTNLAAAGVPDSTARAISGHKTDSAHKRYVIT